MSKRKFLSVLAVSAAASAVLGGVPAAVIAATAGAAGAATDPPAFGSLPPTLAAQLANQSSGSGAQSPAASSLLYWRVVLTMTRPGSTLLRICWVELGPELLLPGCGTAPLGTGFAGAEALLLGWADAEDELAAGW